MAWQSLHKEIKSALGAPTLPIVNRFLVRWNISIMQGSREISKLPHGN
jgi:hypothetical protein